VAVSNADNLGFINSAVTFRYFDPKETVADTEKYLKGLLLPLVGPVQVRVINTKGKRQEPVRPGVAEITCKDSLAALALAQYAVAPVMQIYKTKPEGGLIGPIEGHPLIGRKRDFPSGAEATVEVYCSEWGGEVRAADDLHLASRDLARHATAHPEDDASVGASLALQPVSVLQRGSTASLRLASAVGAVPLLEGQAMRMPSGRTLLFRGSKELGAARREADKYSLRAGPYASDTSLDEDEEQWKDLLRQTKATAHTALDGRVAQRLAERPGDFYVLVRPATQQGMESLLSLFKDHTVFDPLGRRKLYLSLAHENALGGSAAREQVNVQAARQAAAAHSSYAAVVRQQQAGTAAGGRSGQMSDTDAMLLREVALMRQDLSKLHNTAEAGLGQLQQTGTRMVQLQESGAAALSGLQAGQQKLLDAAQQQQEQLGKVAEGQTQVLAGQQGLERRLEMVEEGQTAQTEVLSAMADAAAETRLAAQKGAERAAQNNAALRNILLKLQQRQP
ncbi:hypothetical protein ABPG75_000945, partial [Micractinium tetrahymenae]